MNLLVAVRAHAHDILRGIVARVEIYMVKLQIFRSSADSTNLVPFADELLDVVKVPHTLRSAFHCATFPSDICTARHGFAVGTVGTFPGTKLWHVIASRLGQKISSTNRAHGRNGGPARSSPVFSSGNANAVGTILPHCSGTGMNTPYRLAATGADLRLVSMLLPLLCFRCVEALLRAVPLLEAPFDMLVELVAHHDKLLATLRTVKANPRQVDALRRTFLARRQDGFQ